jgi:GNAT superfamily N-acetyltransferase
MSPSPIIIRAARSADLPALAGLLIAQLRDHDNDVSDADLTAAAGGMLERPQRGRFLLALDGEVAVGFAALSYLWTLERGGRAAWLDELYVRPERRGAGIGAALIDAAVATASAAGARALDLEIETGHEQAAPLYRRFGFHPLPRQRWARPLDPPPAPSAERMRPALAGGCACGAVRYRIEGPASDVCHCHCRLCQRSSGAPVVSWLTVPAPALHWEAGTVRERRSSPHAVRGFCADCGTALIFRADARPDLVDVTVASLDDPAGVAPRRHIWTASAMPWLRLDDDLPRHEREAGDAG